MNSGCPPTDSQLDSGGWAEGERRADKWIHESVIVEAIVEFTYVWGTSMCRKVPDVASAGINRLRLGVDRLRRVGDRHRVVAFAPEALWRRAGTKEP
jgi:hypothetical protein